MAGQAEVVQVVATVVAICAGVATAYFLGAVALALGTAQAAAVTGRPGTLSRAFEPLMPAIICLAVAVNAQSLAEQVAGLIGSQAITDANGVIGVWQAVASMLANTVIVSGGAWLAMGLATGALSAQVAMITGHPYALAGVKGRVMAVLVTAALTAITAQIVEFIIRIVTP